VANYAEEQLLAALGWDQEGPLGAKQAAADKNSHEYAQFAGELAGGTLPAFGAGAVGKLGRAIGAGAGAGFEAGMELYHGDGLDPKKIGMAGAANALLAKPRTWAEAASTRLTPKAYRHGNIAGENPNPDLKPDPAPDHTADQPPDITFDAPPEAKGATLTPDAGEMATANDVGSGGGAGNAKENSPAPEITGAGNPEGAPMFARERTVGGEDYRKGADTPGEQASGVLEKQSPVSPDIAAAMGGEPHQVGAEKTPEQVPRPAEGGTDVLPPRQDAVPTNHLPEGHVPLTEGEAPARPGHEDYGFEAANAGHDFDVPEGHVKLEPTNAVSRREPVPDAQGRVRLEPENALAKISTEPEPRQTGLTPGEIKASTEARRALKEAGYQRVLAEIDRRGLNPRETAEVLRKAKNALESKSGEAVGRENRGAPGQRGVKEGERPSLASGAMARSKKDAARKEAQVQFVGKQYAEFGPGSEAGKVDLNDPAAMKDFAKKTWAEVLKRNNGADPTLRTKDNYVPLKQTDEMADAYQWLKAMKASATGQNHKNFLVQHATKGAGASTRAIGKTEGDIAHRPQLEEVAAEAETATEAREGDREHYPMLEPWKDRQGKLAKDQTFVQQSNELRSFINDLTNKEYEALSEHYDVRAELADPNSPLELKAEMEKLLSDADLGRRALGKGEQEIIPPTKAKKVKPIEEQSLEELTGAKPAEAPKEKVETAKGGKVEVVDRNTEAGKKLFEEYNKKINEPIPEKDADRLKFEEQNLKSAAQTFKDMLHDQSGGTNKAALGLMNWMKKQPNSLTSPDRETHAKQISESLGQEFNEYSKGMGVITSRMRQMATLVPKFPSRKAAFEAYRDAYQHLEDNPDSANDMSIKDEKVFQLVHLTRKMQDEYNKALALIRFHDPEGQMIKLPPFNKMQPFEKGFMNRLRKFDATADQSATDPFHGTERQLSTWKGPLEERTFKTLTDGKGLRVLFNEKESGGIQIWHDGRAVDRSTPIDFEAQIGDTVKVNVNKKPMTLTVDNATAREIMKHARDENGKKIEYHENPILTTANAVIQATQALETMKLLRSVKDNQALRDASRFNPTQKEIKDLNLDQTKLKQFAQLNGKDWYMPRRVAERLDDYRQAGLDEDSLNWLAKSNVNLMKSLWVVSPLIHGFNVGAAWLPQRGFDLLSPKGNMWLAKTTAAAIHAVITQDMKVLGPAMENGLTLMLPGTKNLHMMQAIARKGGHELMTNPPKWWDAMIYPEWGLRASDVGKHMLEGSNTITWGMSDVMTLQRYLENIERRQMWPKDAAHETHQWLPDYMVPPRVGESTLNKIPGLKKYAPAIARAASKGMRSSALSLFGAYHYDLFKTLARTTKGVVNGDPKAAGQMMALAVGTYLIYPYLLDKGAQEITGNEHASVGRRGPMAPFQALGDAVGADQMVNSMIRMLGGTPAKPLVNPPKLNTDIYMAPPLLKLAGEGVANKDFSGHQIYPTSIHEFNQLGWSKATRHLLDWIGSTLLPPYQMLSSELKKPGDKTHVGTRLMHEQVGIREPSPAAVKYHYQGDKNLNKELKYRRRREGPAEGLF
jgi:hypothetical protein